MEQPEARGSEGRKEVWSYNAFIAAYNKLARERAGWLFEADASDTKTEAEIRDVYELPFVRSIREAAEIVFDHDQRRD